MDERRAAAFGVMKIDNTGRIVEFAEKPKGDKLKAMACDTTILGLDKASAQEMPYIASMGIYVFKKSVMEELLTKTFPTANDFGSEIIPGAKDKGLRVQAYLFQGYWEDIGTIESFYTANLALTDQPTPKFSFYDRLAPIYTQSRFLPPSKLIDCDVSRSMIGDGCLIAGARIHHSVVGIRSVIGTGCVIEDALLMGADYYESDEEIKLTSSKIPVGIGANTTIRRAIVDKNARIGAGCQIVNKEGIKESNREKEGFIIKDGGIITVVKDAVLLAGTVI